MVSTPDFESGDPSSSLGRTSGLGISLASFSLDCTQGGASHILDPLKLTWKDVIEVIGQQNVEHNVDAENWKHQFGRLLFELQLDVILVHYLSMMKEPANGKPVPFHKVSNWTPRGSLISRRSALSMPRANPVGEISARIQ